MLLADGMGMQTAIRQPFDRCTPAAPCRSKPWLFEWDIPQAAVAVGPVLAGAVRSAAHGALAEAAGTLAPALELPVWGERGRLRERQCCGLRVLGTSPACNARQ